jgi:hypothetical protein
MIQYITYYPASLDSQRRKKNLAQNAKMVAKHSGVFFYTQTIKINWWIATSSTLTQSQ